MKTIALLILAGSLTVIGIEALGQKSTKGLSSSGMMLNNMLTTPDQNGTNGSVKMAREQLRQQNSTNQNTPQWPSPAIGTNLPANNGEVAPVNGNPNPITPPAKK